MHRGISSVVTGIGTRSVLHQQLHINWVVRENSEMQWASLVVLIANLIWRVLAFFKEEL